MSMRDSKKTQPAAISDSRPVAISSGNELPIIQQGDNMLVDARYLHQRLGSKRQFSDWIKSRITNPRILEGRDYFATRRREAVRKGGGHNRTDYLLTTEIAKHFAMMEDTDAGWQIRDAFIEAEKLARGISQLPKEAALFKGLKPKTINDRKLYPYQAIVERCGYNPKSSSAARRAKYWQHFLKEGHILYITQEFALHLFHSRQVYNNRSALQHMQPVLPFSFGEGGLTKGGAQ